MKKTLFFFDFETPTDANNLMIPFYCLVQKVCKKCEKIDFKKKKEFRFEEQEELACCGRREFVFEGDDVISKICEFMLIHEKSVWIAHDGGRFDTIFIFKYLLEQHFFYPETIMHSNKVMILYIRDHNIDIFYSYAFIQMRLAAIPKAMGLEDLCKGFHPYFFMI